MASLCVSELLLCNRSSQTWRLNAASTIASYSLGVRNRSRGGSQGCGHLRARRLGGPFQAPPRGCHRPQFLPGAGWGRRFCTSKSNPSHAQGRDCIKARIPLVGGVGSPTRSGPLLKLSRPRRPWRLSPCSPPTPPRAPSVGPGLAFQPLSPLVQLSPLLALQLCHHFLTVTPPWPVPSSSLLPAL